MYRCVGVFVSVCVHVCVTWMSICGMCVNLRYLCLCVLEDVCCNMCVHLWHMYSGWCIHVGCVHVECMSEMHV